MSSWGKKSEPTNNNEPAPKADNTTTEGTKGDAPPPENPPQQAPMRLNKETADPEALINPHNEALAQRPVENAEQKMNAAEEFLRKGTHLGRLQDWKQRVFLGGPRQGEWEEFDQIIQDEFQKRKAETTPSPKPEEPTTDAERERLRKRDDDIRKRGG